MSTPLISLLEIFLMYLLVSFLFRLILQILPETISSAFDIIGDIRAGLTKFIRSLYKTEDNFEVNMLSVFFVPFAMMLLVFSIGSALVILNTDAPIINVWLVVVLIFVVSFIAPTESELQAFRKPDSASIFMFIFKVFLILQFVADPIFPHPDIISLVVLLTPISPWIK